MRRILSLAAVLLVVLVGLDTLLWRWAQLQLDAAFAACHAAGWTITAAPMQRGGWPLAATLSMPDLVVAEPGLLTWSTDRLTLTISLLHPAVLRIAAEGMQRLKLGDLPEVGYTADRLDANLPLEPVTPPRRVALAVADLREAGGIGLPPGRRWPFGPLLASLTLDASISDGGRTITVQHLAIRWGRLDATATGTIGFDERTGPSGSGMVRIVEPSGALAELVANGALADRTAFAANAMLALMTHGSPAGGAPAVELPLALHNQLLSIGQIPLAKLPLPTLPTAP